MYVYIRGGSGPLSLRKQRKCIRDWRGKIRIDRILNARIIGFILVKNEVYESTDVTSICILKQWET